MISLLGYEWKEIKYNKRLTEKIKQDYQLSSLVSKIVVNRKFNSEEIYSIKHNVDVLNPFLKDTDFLNAKTLILEFIKNKKKILIIGDYDVDGSVSTALLINFFNRINHPCDFYIPDRVDDGYGISEKLFKKIKNKLTDLIIIVDSGSKSYKPIDYLNSLNINTIIIDHHEISKPFPKSTILINPKKKNNISTLHNLCASALVYFLIDMISKNFKNKISLNENLLLAALGTICDVMNLRDLNRNIIIKALSEFNPKDNFFIKNLLEIFNKKNKLTVDDFGYLIGPILNSGGRLHNSNLATKVLISNNKEEIKKISNKLISLNEKRKKIENNIIKEIDFDNEELRNNEIILLKKTNIPEGLIGIIAARLVDRFNKPSIVITQSNSVLKGSARSIPEINIGTIINNAVSKNYLLSGGGHSMAAGFILKKNEYGNFEKFINKQKFKLTNKLQKEYVSKISSSAINIDFIDDFNKLKPFGNANSHPKFLIERLKIFKPKIINNFHIQCLLKDDKNKFHDSFAFNARNTKLSEYLLNYKKEIAIICQLRLHYKNNNKINILIDDIIA